MNRFVTNDAAKIWTNISDTLHCNKPYLCMCGGGPGVSDELSEVDPLFNTRFNTIRFNQRGCGSSTADGKYDIETTIDDIESIRKFYGIESWYMLGHSWGANIALFYSLQFPQFCKGIIYLCGLGVQNDADWHSECAQNAADLKEPERPICEGYFMNYDVLNGALNSYSKYIQNPMLYKNISKHQVPICIICAEKDIRPVWPVFQLSNLLPKATLKVLYECGHFPWLSHPDLLRKTIFDWVDNTAV